MRRLASLLLTALAVFHVTAVREWTRDDPGYTPGRPFHTYVVEGTLNGKLYTTQQLFTWGSQHFAVGSDYTAVKVDDHALTVEMQDKKGRAFKERLDITGVKEEQ